MQRSAGGVGVVAWSSLVSCGFRRSYDNWITYGQSKTANALFAVGVDHPEAEGACAFSLHPGSLFTPLSRHLDIDDYRRVGAVDADGNLLSTEQAGFKSLEQGDATLVWCATSHQLDGMGGGYCEDSDIAPLAVSESEKTGERPWAVDPKLARRLWTASEQLTGVDFRPVTVLDGHQPFSFASSSSFPIAFVTA
jgi:NAD(P)-dependent dehydrogenase (short-subunit alcohol dehydrogenase family)